MLDRLSYPPICPACDSKPTGRDQRHQPVRFEQHGALFLCRLCGCRWEQRGPSEPPRPFAPHLQEPEVRRRLVERLGRQPHEPP
jgi:hypothetical protein